MCSTACDRYGYGRGPCRASAAGDSVSLAAETETESAQYGKLRWAGHIRGEKLDGTMTMACNGKATGEKWVVAGETK